MPEFKTFADFLLWLISGPGLVICVGVFSSYVLAKLKVWNGLPGDVKFVAVLALPGVFLIPGVYIALHMGLIVQDDVLNRIFVALLFYFTTQVTYGKLKAANVLRLPSPSPVKK